VSGWMPVETGEVSFVGELPRGAIYPDFAPFDWAPMTFIFRRGELKTPLHLDDLLKSDYANSLALQDPHSSSTGLYFLIWILAQKGEAAGLKYLKALKPSIRIISPSWSASYSLFQNNQAPMVFSYFTSSIYHYVNENDNRYQPVYFDDPHIYSVEYMGIPQSCVNCKTAQAFVKHVLSAESQKTIMEKNYMLPAVRGVKRGTPFDFPKSIKLIDPKHYEDLLGKKDEILKAWSELQL
jgi:thiamine transport system substrate-binding protein